MIRQSELLEAMKAQLPFRVATRLLKESGFPTGRSWIDILEKLDDRDSQRSASTSALTTRYEEALAVCDKLVTLYEFDETHLNRAHKVAEEIGRNISSHPFVDQFPLPVPASQLEKLPQNEAIPTRVLETDGATVIIYCTARLLETREHIATNQLDPILVGRYSDVVGVRKSYEQAFNAIVIPYFGNCIVVQSDIRRPMTHESAVFDQITLRNTFNKAFGGNILGSPVNLFPAIGPLYQSEEGEVCRLSHTVTQGIKHERMRGNRCVRQERFHQGGAAAVRGNLTPYQIVIRWHLDEPELSGDPELHLLGDYRSTYQAAPILTEARIDHCPSYRESAFVVGKLRDHL